MSALSGLPLMTSEMGSLPQAHCLADQSAQPDEHYQNGTHAPADLPHGCHDHTQSVDQLGQSQGNRNGKRTITLQPAEQSVIDSFWCLSSVKQQLPFLPSLPG